MAVDPVTKAKLRQEREKMLLQGVRDQALSALDSRYAALDHQYDMVKANLDKQYADVEQRVGLLERGRALRGVQEMGQAKAQVAEAKAAAAASTGSPALPSETLDDLYQPVNPGQQVANPAQLPVTSIGPGGPQGVQMAKAEPAGPADGGVPPWLVSGRTMSETGTRDFGAGIFMPDTATRSVVDVAQNAPTADATIKTQAFLQKAREAAALAQTNALVERVGQMLAAGQADPRVAALGEAMLNSLPPELQSQAVQVAGALQGKEATGTSRVRLQGPGDNPVLVPGYMAPPGATGFNDRPQTNVNVSNVVMPDVPTMPTINDLQAQAVGATRSIDSLARIAETYQPAFLTYRGKIKASIGDIMSKAEADLSPEEREFRTQYGRFKSAVGTNLADTIRAATGAQMSDREWARFQQFMPNESMSPERFAGAWQQAMTTAMYSVARANYFAQGGFGDEQMESIIGRVPQDTLLGAVPLDSVKGLIQAHKGTLEEQLTMRGVAPVDARKQASRQTLKDFGIERFYDTNLLNVGQTE